MGPRSFKNTHTVQKLGALRTALAEGRNVGRTLEADEKRGPFATYRWARHPGNESGRTSHPQKGSAQYGIVAATNLLYAAPMMATSATYTSTDPLFRLATDMWLVGPVSALLYKYYKYYLY